MLNKRKAYYFLIGLFFFLYNSSIAQDQRLADSLVLIFEADTVVGEQKLELLRKLTFNEINDQNKALFYAEELIKLANSAENIAYESQGYYQKGNALQRKGNLEEAIQAYFKCAELALLDDKVELEGSAYGAVADIYSISGDHKNSSTYYIKSIETLKSGNDSISLASVIMNYGFDLYENEKYDLALTQFTTSGDIFEEVNYILGKAYNLGNIGMVYANIGDNSLAENNINNAVEILEEYEDHYAISDYLLSMTDIYVEKEAFSAALGYAEKSLSLVNNYGLKEQISDANLKLSELHEALGNSKKSLEHYKNHIVYRDSLNNVESVRKIADLRTEFEVSEKQAQVDLVNQQKRNQLIIIGFISLLLLTLIYFYRTISREKKRSESLLLNILPEETAQELKQHGKVAARKIESATVLFTDFKGFTSYAEGLSPEELVETVDYYFSKFDQIVESHGLEKIKTIGDAYMCAGGLHGDITNHAQKMINAAFDMSNFVKQTKADESKEKLPFDIRIGINTGPVVAGVVGTKKFAYDIWGDTVNVASRMESNSEPGKINISQETFDLVKDDFNCEFRGELTVKNRGSMKMYFVKNDKQLHLSKETEVLEA